MVPEIWLSMRGCVCQSVDGHDDEAESEGRGQCDCLALAEAHKHGGVRLIPLPDRQHQVDSSSHAGPGSLIFGTMKTSAFEQTDNQGLSQLFLAVSWDI